MEQRDYRALIGDLLADSPITSAKVIGDVRELLSVGEYGLAFNTLCSWIYEDALPIDESFHGRLGEIADEMDSTGLVERLKELVD